MNLDTLKKLLSRKNQRFDCVATDSPNNDKKFTANIRHDVSAPMGDKEIKLLKKKFGNQEQLFTLLSHYGSVRLYCDTLSEDSAFYIAHPNEWDELNAEFKEWIDNLDEDEAEELLPNWLNDAIVIGEFPSSGNYYLFLIKGEQQGTIFEFEHDGFEFLEVGKDLESFLNHICTVTDALIQNILSHTRYSDGKTETQWLAQKYEFDKWN